MCRLLYSRPAAPRDFMRTVPNSVALICLVLAACASVPNAPPPAPAPAAACPQPVAPTVTAAPPPPLPISLANNLRPATWSDLPGWSEDSVLDAFATFLQSQREFAAAMHEYERFIDLAADTYPAASLAQVRQHILALKQLTP